MNGGLKWDVSMKTNQTSVKYLLKSIVDNARFKKPELRNRVLLGLKYGMLIWKMLVSYSCLVEPGKNHLNSCSHNIRCFHLVDEFGIKISSFSLSVQKDLQIQVF